MAMTVSASIQLNDLMSGPIKHIMSSLDIMCDCMDRVDTATNAGFDSSAIFQMRQHIDIANTELAETAERLDKIHNKANGAANATRDVADASDSWLEKITKIGAGYLSLRAAIDGIKFTVGYSDDLTMLQSRLNLMNDGTQTTAELFDKVYLSAQDARGSVTDMAAVVARFGNNAKDAFSGNDEVIKFANLVQKQMTIAGATTSEASNAILQLSQGLGSGVLRGDELNSVFENAPNLIQNIADYLEVPIGEIRDMASDGEITADIVKNAIMAAADDIEAKFNSMPMTWEQTFNKFKNTAVDAFRPVADKISEIINTQEFQDALENMGESLSVIADAVTDIIDGISSAVEFVSDNWDLISPILGAIAAVMTLYYAIKGINGIVKLASTAVAAFGVVWEACPALVVIIGIIAAIYLVIAVINKLTGKTISALGVIFGALLTIGAFVWNIIVGVINGVVQFVYLAVEIVVGFIELLINATSGGLDGFLGSVANFVGQVVSWLISIVKVVTQIVDAAFGFKLTDALTKLQNEVVKWGKKKNAFTVDPKWHEAPKLLNRIEYGKTFNSGYNWGSDLFDFSKKEYGPHEGFDSLLTGIDTSSLTDSTDETAKNTKKIADNTEKTNNLFDLVRENLERKAIAEYTANTKVQTVDLSGMTNTYYNTNDAFDMVKELGRYLNQKHSTSAEGV